MPRTKEEREALLQPTHMIFVFGSNLGGHHGLGAARYAYQKKGAEYGVGVGPRGESYAIPTKSVDIKRTLPLNNIRYYVDMFVEYARKHPELKFQVTRIGCGLAGLRDAEVAPLFRNAGENCLFDEAWKPWLETKNFWGTF